ncbi:hypothetical protein VMCG_04523 [Cytospora schulzeri]|uniref:Uncharacterized protein n=1 Tax=Cytospora schulzeri TaxID=448051 RepID=A0A423WRG2_9PEZI|nr:hypothetical protein VMCG_04523 [Valsa malicola]
MMHSFVGASLPGVPHIPAQYTHDALLEDLSRQMGVSPSRRQSRGSNGALSGNSMRVAKPSSASNSPRNSLMQQRRRTMMNDPVFIQRATQMLEQPYLPTPGPEVYSNVYYEPVNKRAARPVSWHPSTQQLPQQIQQMPAVPTQTTQYPFPSYYDTDFYNPPTQFPPTPAAYSAYSSPVSTLSPLTLPYSTWELPPPQVETYSSHVCSSPSWDVTAAPMASTVPAMNSVPAPTYDSICDFTPAAVPYQSQSPDDWSCYGSQSMATPPTPEDPPRMHQPEPVLQNEESIPYQALEENEDEEEGDILIGLGLYDPPEKLPYHGEGGLLGASFEPMGKGLKLEDAWEPPASDDEDDDEDGEGEAEAADDE